MAQTLQWLRDIYYAILKEDEDSSAYPLILTDSLLNSTQRNICAWNLIDLTTQKKEQIQKTSLPFISTDKFYSSVQDNYLDTTAIVWWTTLSLADSSNFASSGKLWINENIITYTGNTWTWFTWVTWIEFAHLSWSRVSQLFDLPTDFASSTRVIYDNRKALDPIDYKNLYLELNNFKPGSVWTTWPIDTTNNSSGFIWDWIRPFYTIIHGTYLLPFQYDVSNNMIHMLYEKKPTTLSSWTDEAIIPEEYADVIAYIAVAKTLYNRWEEDRALKLWNYWLWEVLSMYDFYWKQNMEKLSNQRVETGKDAILNI